MESEIKQYCKGATLISILKGIVWIDNCCFISPALINNYLAYVHGKIKDLGLPVSLSHTFAAPISLFLKHSNS